MKFNCKEDIIQITPLWKGERMEDGRPKVSSDVLRRLRKITLEEAWGPLWQKGYKYQFEGEFRTTHPGATLVGRAVTGVYVPMRPDLNDYLLKYGHEEEGRKGYFNQWVIDSLVEDDVVVVDMFDKIFQGTYVGGNLSTAKSPQQMFGAVAKSYFAQKLGVDPHDIFVVSIMPCTAKKSEAALPTMRDACGDADVDVVLTTREIVRMFRGEQINPAVLDETPFDSPLGSGTGAAVIFGATGGVMDAALRSAYYLVTGKNPDPDAFRDIRGMDGWKDAKFEIPGAGVVSVAVASGLLNTRKLMTALERGEVRYDFVEIMACPGGCAGGGGQPIHDGVELAEKRGSVLWSIDKAAPCRFSHENPDVRELYRDYLKKPLSDVSHHLLHTDHQAWKMPSQK